jgi:signal transduction histidine kinase
MKKTNFLWKILDLIFLIIFNVVFFLFGGFSHKAAVWISYGFIHFAYLMLLLTPFLIRRGKSAAVFGFSLYSISAVYFIIELVIGIIFILVFPERYTIPLLVQLIIAGLYGIILISNMIANEHTADAEENRQYQISYVKDASAKLKSLMENISDKETKKKVEKLYDTVYSSPVKSHSALTQMENRILQSLNEFENEISAGNKETIISSANSLLIAVNERNMQLKTLN